MKSFIKKIISLERLKNNGDYVKSKKYKKTRFTRPLFFLDLSSRWDFICSFPLVFYISKGLGVLTIPFALLISLCIIIIANYVGLYTIQRQNNFLRLFISLILFILMLLRISFSGVGIHLATQSKYLKENKAIEILSQNLTDNFYDLKKLENGLNPLALLYVSSRGSYYAHFNGDPFAAESYKKVWLKIDPSLGTKLNPDCEDQDEKCKGSVRWAGGNQAIKAATIDFYKKYSRRDFKSLGLSFVGFVISLILNSITILSFITLPNKSN